MHAATASPLSAWAGRLLCVHFALAMLSAATISAQGQDALRPAAYTAWALLPLTAIVWALTRAYTGSRSPHAHSSPATSDPHIDDRAA